MLTMHWYPHFSAFLPFVKDSFTASSPGALKGSTLCFIQCLCGNCAALTKEKTAKPKPGRRNLKLCRAERNSPGALRGGRRDVQIRGKQTGERVLIRQKVLSPVNLRVSGQQDGLRSPPQDGQRRSAATWLLAASWQNS